MEPPHPLHQWSNTALRAVYRLKLDDCIGIALDAILMVSCDLRNRQR
jgi:hypothetical protein